MPDRRAQAHAARRVDPAQERPQLALLDDAREPELLAAAPCPNARRLAATSVVVVETALFTVVAVVLADPLFGGALFGTLWLGRAFPASLLPLVEGRTADMTRLLDGIEGHYNKLRTLNLIAVSTSALTIATWMASETVIP
jgi:hypothetical protein